MSMTTKVLLLTQGWAAHKIVSLERAIGMLILGKLSLVEQYDEVLTIMSSDRIHDFPHLARAYGRTYNDGLGELILHSPAVAVLTKPVGSMKRGIKFSRINVYTRDGYACQYCGNKYSATHLNYDHLIPRQRGGKTTWENIVTACYECNEKKANRTPEEAGMKVKRVPYKPKSLPMLGPRFSPDMIHDLWRPYIGEIGDSGFSSTVVAQ